MKAESDTERMGMEEKPLTSTESYESVFDNARAEEEETAGGSIHTQVSWIRKNSKGILIGCWGFVLVGFYLISELVEEGSIVHLFQHLIEPSMIYFHFLAFLLIPASMLTGYFYQKQLNLTESLEQRVEERTRNLHESARMLKERDEDLRLLENPLLEVADNVVALPLIGVIDSRRASTMMESLLNNVAERDTELVILDMTGIFSVDAATAQYLMQTIEAMRLMGSDAVITGIRPDVAVTLANIGMEFADIRTFSTLKEGIKHALNEKGAKRQEPSALTRATTNSEWSVNKYEKGVDVSSESNL